MRYVIYGAGAVGGVIGARLFHAGYDVVLVCRGEHYEVINRDGLTLKTPVEHLCERVPAVQHPREVQYTEDDVVLLTMRAQDIVEALDELRPAAGDRSAIICAQNGVESERQALRRFSRVYGMVVRFPGMYLEPGKVLNYEEHGGGRLRMGRYPEGIDDLMRSVAEDVEHAGFKPELEPKIMRTKYDKLILNVGSAFAGVFGATGHGDSNLRTDTMAIRRALEAEVYACYEAAGIEYSTQKDVPHGWGDIEGERAFGSSHWQGIVRGRRSAENDYINGEIVMLGVMHGVPTPYNRMFNALTNYCAREGIEPGTFTVQDFDDMVAGKRPLPRQRGPEAGPP